MSNANTQYFTAAQIARALEQTPRAIRRLLEFVPATANRQVNGSEARCWSLSDLPLAVREQLQTAALKKGYRDALSFLAMPPAEPWQPAIPLSEVASEFRAAAALLRQALLPTFARMDNTMMSAADFELLGVNDYARVFGERISTRHWRRLLNRTLGRDQGNEDWQRLEIYLPDNARRAASVAKLGMQTKGEMFRHVLSTLALIAEKGAPTLREVDLIWEAVLQDFELGREGGRAARLKRELLEFVLSQVRIASSFNSARTLFDTKHKAWLAGGKQLSAIANKKLRDNQPAAPEDEQLKERAERLGFLAGKKYGGRVAPALRDLVEQGLEQPSQSTSKSYVNRELLRLARPVALTVAAATTNQRTFRDMIPKLTCDPHKYFVNDIFTADDFTFPVMWYVPDGDWFKVVQGQCLIVADWRSWRVLQFSLQPDAQYNSKVIRTLFAKTFAAHNLPKELRLEGGIWRSSKLIHGNDARREAAAVAGLEFTDGDVVYGLKSQLGINISHAISPTGKTQIESIGRLVQDLMWGDKGYCGRDQRTDLPDLVKRQKYEVEHKQAHPSEYFYSFREWEERLHQIFEEYNRTRQQGQWLNNESPDEAFEKYQNRQDPPIAFDARCAHLLACQVSEREIKQDHSIRFKIGAEPFVYFGTDLMDFVPGTRVLVHFDPELPEAITVTDLKRRNPFSVPRSERTGNKNDPITKSELGKKKACEGYLRARYRTLAAKHKAVVRTPVVTKDVVELGAAIKQQRAKISDENKERESLHRRAIKLTEALGFPLAGVPRDVTPEYVEGLEQMRALRVEEENQP